MNTKTISLSGRFPISLGRQSERADYGMAPPLLAGVLVIALLFAARGEDAQGAVQVRQSRLYALYLSLYQIREKRHFHKLCRVELNRDSHVITSGSVDAA